VALDAVPAAIAAGIHPGLPAALGALGGWEESVERRATPGGSARASVQAQLAELQHLFIDSLRAD